MSDRFDAEIEALLRFYADAGYDQPLDDEPHDRFAPSGGVATLAAAPEAKAAPAAQPAAARAAPRPAAAVPAEAQAERARALAAQAPDLAALQSLLSAFDGCNLKNTAKQLVFGDGNPNAPIMFVGEVPKREEDLEGRAFAGRSGQLLDRMLAAIGLDREGVYLAHVVPWRPPGNRDPSAPELSICRPFLERQIELVAPRILVTLGNPPTRMLLSAREAITKSRGAWQTYRTASGVEIDTMPTFDPEYLLRNPAHKKLAWRDLLEIKARLAAL